MKATRFAAFRLFAGTEWFRERMMQRCSKFHDDPKAVPGALASQLSVSKGWPPDLHLLISRKYSAKYQDEISPPKIPQLPPVSHQKKISQKSFSWLICGKKMLKLSILLPAQVCNWSAVACGANFVRINDANRWLTESKVDVTSRKNWRDQARK